MEVVDSDSEDEESEDEQYEVEELLDSRLAGRTTEYLVKWVGWDEPSDNSWEPEANIHPDLIAAYLTAAGAS